MSCGTRGMGVRGVKARGDGLPITPHAPVPRTSRDMKTTGDESAIAGLPQQFVVCRFLMHHWYPSVTTSDLFFKS